MCVDCFNLTRGFARCFACSHSEAHLAVMVPISYSVDHEELHHMLWTYKRLEGSEADRARDGLAAILWRFLARHETCVAAAAGTSRFDVVTTVPSGEARRDEHHPLHAVVGQLVGPTRDRHERLLRRTDEQAEPRRFDRDRFRCIRDVGGANVLLIDDTWTTGSSAQSAAAALKDAGAGQVAAVVVGRYINRGWHENHMRISGLAHPFDWSICALCADRDHERRAA